jgi:hypothetical protein
VQYSSVSWHYCNLAAGGLALAVLEIHVGCGISTPL